MAADIQELLVALKAWQRAIKQLNHQERSLAARRQAVTQASEVVLQALASDRVEAEIDQLIQAAAISNDFSSQQVRNQLQQNPDDLIKVELRSVRPIPVSRTKFETLTTAFLESSDSEQPLDDSEQLRQVFLTLSSTLPEAYLATTELSRKPKKRRRRDLMLSALQTVLGVGLIAGNTQIEAAMSNASYILGGNALISALQNLVGQAE